MKKNIILCGLAGLAASGLLTGCSDSYLDLAPVTTTSSAAVSEGLDAAKLAVRGIGTAMQGQYQDAPDWYDVSGEAYINSLYNESMGQDYNHYLWQRINTGDYVNWDFMGRESYPTAVALPWMYDYYLIYLANGVLQGVDTAEGEEAERALIKAQALTYRAHGYIKLLQLYAPRWEDSNNGDAYCLVKRTEPSMSDAPLVKMSEIKELVYNDLTLAIDLFKQAREGEMDRERKWEPCLQVAQGLYSRAALLFHDWELAQNMAHDAQSGFSVMDNDTALSGFIDDNDDFMWAQGVEPSDIYYWAWGNWNACNGNYVMASTWSGAGYISLDLYNQLAKDDIRRQWFLTPDKLETATTQMNPGKLKPEDFWNGDLVVSTSMDLTKGQKVPAADASKKAGMVNFAIQYSYNYLNNIFKGDKSKVTQYDKDDKSTHANYFRYQSAADPNGGTVIVAKGVYAFPVCTNFGAQYKFWGDISKYGVSSYPFMRCAEMVLNEAEAAYMAGDEGTAKTCLEKINKMRVPGYSCTSSGQALLDEIRLCKRIELWGEGFSWPDLKRWNLPCVRRAWVAGDPTSGNVPASCAMTRQPNENAGWRYTVPRNESDYNKLLDRGLLPALGEYSNAN